MARVMEFHTQGSWLGKQLDRLLNSQWLCIDTARITSDAWVWGSIWEDDEWHDEARYCFDKSLFYNGRWFYRKVYVDGKLRGRFASFRWSGSQRSKAYLQVGYGFKLNGRYAFTFRVQSDRTSAAGVRGPNHGQAVGWFYGTK